MPLRHPTAAGLALILFAVSALVADWVTTYSALTSSDHAYGESTPSVAALIQSYGLDLGLLVSVLVRLMVFGLVVLVAQKMPRAVALPLLACGFFSALWTWWVALENLLIMTHPS